MICLLFTSHKKEVAAKIKKVQKVIREEESKKRKKKEERGKEMNTSRSGSTEKQWQEQEDAVEKKQLWEEKIQTNSESWEAHSIQLFKP